jgi:hypothetical protein
MPDAVVIILSADLFAMNRLAKTFLPANIPKGRDACKMRYRPASYTRIDPK